jgi:hypothetical protein
MPYMHRSLAMAAVALAATFLTSCKSDTYPVHTFQLGDKVQVGQIIYSVFETEWLPQIGEGTTARIPKNRFFLVRLSATNSGSSTVTIPGLTIADDSGKTYSEIDGDGAPQWIGLLREVKPADSVQGNIIFDAPPAHYKLRVMDEDMERAALVDIPLSFSAETPQVPTPGGAKEQ